MTETLTTETALLVLLVGTLPVVVAWRRNPHPWVDALLVIGIVVTIALLALVLLG